MASKLKFDELNNLISEYYEPMEISKEQKLERIELAELLFDVFLFMFIYIDAQKSASVSIEIDKDAIKEMFSRRYKDAVKEYGISFDKYDKLSDYIDTVSEEMVDSSFDSDTIKDSQERALFVAENESNTIFNQVEYDDAVASGKRYKTWITENDLKVRKTHKDVHNKTIPIDEYFKVGNSLMLYPKDINAELREIINCRCSIKYDKEPPMYYIKGGIDAVNKRADKMGMFDFLKTVNPDVANGFLDEREKAEKIFGKFQVDSIRLLETSDNIDGWYQNGKILLKNIAGKNAPQRLKERAIQMKQGGKWSTNAQYHSIRHEYGHAIVENYKLQANWDLKEKEIRDIFNKTYKPYNDDNIEILKREYASKLSIYGYESNMIEEFVAESIAEYLNGKCRPLAKSVVEILLRE